MARTEVTGIDLAESLIATLEGSCVAAGRLEILSFLGMARAELAACRPPRGRRLQVFHVSSLSDGLDRLDLLLGQLTTASTEPSHRLRLVTAHQLVHEARNDASSIG